MCVVVKIYESKNEIIFYQNIIQLFGDFEHDTFIRDLF